VAASLIDSVSDTAFWVAHYRGLEGERADALFQVPLAARLSGDHGKQIARSMPGANFTSWAVVMRTCLIDDYIRFAIDGGVDTVINLGAGLDTRPYRMELSGSLTWLEVDYPAVIALKEERLREEVPRCRLARLAADLANETEREEMLSSANAGARKMLVITEGVVPYLSEGDVASLAELSAVSMSVIPASIAAWIAFTPSSSEGRPSLERFQAPNPSSLTSLSPIRRVFMRVPFSHSAYVTKHYVPCSLDAMNVAHRLSAMEVGVNIVGNLGELVD
jgi:methyltransferase (TIGR00027 family)